MTERLTGSDSVLIVGGTGILRPAARLLAARGCTVGVVSRSVDRVATLSAECAAAGASGKIVGIRADYFDIPAFEAAIREVAGRYGLFKDCMFYFADAPQVALDAAAVGVRGQFIVVLTSRFAGPDRPNGRPGYPVPRDVEPHRVSYLVLGWHAGPTSNRWHTPWEVSDAAVRVLDEGRDAVLGVLQPWDQRPG